jgi:hypothetical protein
MPKLTQRYAHVINYTDLPEITWRQIEHFFAHYKDLEGGKWVTFAAGGMPMRPNALSQRRSTGRKAKSRIGLVTLNVLMSAQGSIASALPCYLNVRSGDA